MARAAEWARGPTEEMIMFKNLKDLFPPQEEPQPADHRERVKIATCILMLEAARIDEDFADEERDQILVTLSNRYDLSEAEALELLDLSKKSRAESVDVWQFTNQINKACSLKEKIEIVEEVWRVVVADEGIHGNESHFMRQLGRLLNLTSPQVIDAKVKVLDEVRGAG